MVGNEDDTSVRMHFEEFRLFPIQYTFRVLHLLLHFSLPHATLADAKRRLRLRAFRLALLVSLTP